MQEFALLPVWPCKDGIIAVQLRLRVHQATAQRRAFLFAACQKDNLVLSNLARPESQTILISSWRGGREGQASLPLLEKQVEGGPSLARTSPQRTTPEG